jgi:hypothetical protein
MEWKKLSRVLRTFNWIILFVLASISFLFMNHAFTLGIILGGLIIIANFNVLQHTVLAGFSPDGSLQARKASIIAKYYLRITIMGFLIFILIRQQWVDPVGLAIGLSIVVVSILCLGIHMIWKTSSGEAI